MDEVRQLPYDREAEMSVLGAIYYDPECYFDVCKMITASDFYFNANQELFVALGSCIETMNLVSIKTELERRGTLNVVGGIEYMVEVANLFPHGSSAKTFAKIVKECSTRRRLIACTEKANDRLFRWTEDVGDIVDFLQEGITSEAETDSTVKDIGESMFQFIDELDRRRELKEKLPGISTGFEEMDEVTGGLEPGKLYVLGGRPSMGKTALALSMASKIAFNGHTVMYFSLEMKNYEISKRIASNVSRFPASKIKMADLKEKEVVDIADAVGRFDPSTMYIDDNGYQTMQSILSSCIRQNARLSRIGKKIECIMIDHMHLLSFTNKRADRRLQIGEASRAAKLLADRMNCPVIMLSQLSRAASGRNNPKPLLSDLRESGDIEQDADVVMFVHREEYYKPTKENQGVAEIIFAKNRDGECGIVKMGWNRRYTSFESWDEYTRGYERKK